MKYTVNVLIDGCYNKSEDIFTTTNEVRYLSFIAYCKDFYKGKEMYFNNSESRKLKRTDILVVI